MPEKTVGRGLRLMFQGTGSGYIERVDVIGNKTFIEFVEQLEREENLQLDTFEIGKDTAVTVTIPPNEKKKDTDVLIPVLSPVRTRKKSLAEEIGELDVNVANKDRAAELWCENATQLADRPWACLKVLQAEFIRLQPQTS